MFKKLLGILLVICCLTVYAGAETQTDDLIGTINGHTYENRILGIGCSLPDWKYASKEEIQAIWQQTLSAIPDNVSDLVESSGNVTLMFANDASGAQNVNIQIQKQNAAVLTMIDSYGMNGYMAAIQDELASTYESMGMENVQLTTDEIQISGKPFSCFGCVKSFL